MKNTSFKKPNPFVYYFGGLLVSIINKVYFRVKIDKSGLKNIKGPAVILSNHLSNYDFLYVGVAILPKRATYVVSQHFIENPVSRKLLSPIHVIPKKMFTADIRTIKSIFASKDSGNIIVIFPEGKLGVNGRTLNITEGTPELLKKLNVPIYSLMLDGAYKALPKWSKAGFRRGKISIKTKLLLSKDDVTNMTIDEIRHAVELGMYHSEDDNTSISYKCKRPALGLDSILYKCPNCKEEFKLNTNEHFIYCDCGYKNELKENYEFTNGPFKKITEWYDWEENEIDLNKPLEMFSEIWTKNSEGNKVNAGTGYIKLTKDEISFDGFVFDEPFSFTEKTSVIKSLPITVADHFDLYSNGILYTFSPLKDKRVVIKWVQFMEKLENLNNKNR